MKGSSVGIGNLANVNFKSGVKDINDIKIQNYKLNTQKLQ